MALNATTLSSAIESAIKAIDYDSDTRKELADAIATAVIDHIKNYGVVTVASGIAVATAGTATAQTGATTAPGTGTIA